MILPRDSIKAFCRPVLLILLVLLSDNSSAGHNYYQIMAHESLLSTVNYYNSYVDCLKSSSGACDYTNKASTSKHLENTIIISDGLTQRYRKLYPSETNAKLVSRQGTLSDAREDFYKNVIYLQRKLLIFMAVTERDCGKTEAYAATKQYAFDLMDYYIKGDLLSRYTIKIPKDDDFFDKYETSIVENKVYKSRDECEFYLRNNSRIRHDVFVIPVDAAKKSWKTEVALAYFVDMLMIKMLNAD